MQRERGHLAVYHTSPQSLIKTFSYSLAKQPEEHLLNLDGLVSLVKCPKVSTINFDQQKTYFSVSSLGMYINLTTIVLSV